MQLHRCFEYFVVMNHVNRQIKRHHMKDQWYDVWRSMVLRRFLKTIQDKKNSFRVSRSFQTEERSKAGSKCKNSHLEVASCASRLQAIHHCTWDSFPLPNAPPSPLACAAALFCGQKLSFGCFPSWSGRKSLVFFS